VNQGLLGPDAIPAGCALSSRETKNTFFTVIYFIVGDRNKSLDFRTTRLGRPHCHRSSGDANASIASRYPRFVTIAKRPSVARDDATIRQFLFLKKRIIFDSGA
jgi:hypothetical protein